MTGGRIKGRSEGRPEGRCWPVTPRGAGRGAAARSPAAAVLLLGACVSSPDYAPPQTVAAIAGALDFDDFNNEPAAAEAVRVSQLRWWAGVGGEELDALVAPLLAGNLDLKAARARIDQSRALARQARGARLPTLAASADSGGLRLLDPQVSPWEDTYTASLSAGWNTDVFGGLRKADRAARLRADAAVLSEHALKQSLIAELARAYVAAYALKRDVEIARALAASFEETAALSDQRYRIGSQSVGALDVQIARQNAASAAAAVPTLEAQYVIQLQAIDVLLARAPGTTALSFAAMPDARGFKALPAGAPADILSERPDVALAEAEYRAGLNDVGVARADLYPDITLSGVLTRASTPANVLGAQTLVTTLVAEAVAPLYEGGRRRAEVRRAEAAARELAAAFESAALAAVREVETALALEAAGVRTLALRDVSLNAARLSDRIASERYAAGQIGLLTVLETRRSLDVARQDLVAAEEARLNARIDLHLALGGAWFADVKEDSPNEPS